VARGDLPQLRRLIRQLIHCVARLAALHATEADLEAIRSALDQHATDHAHRVATSSSRFYAALRDAAHNSVLAAASASLEKRARFYVNGQFEIPVGGQLMSLSADR
jgi:DNA-binding FadR family transcriptional regulator